ncbi:MAG: hypothetical protein AAGK14_15370 [Verrucomicrobiota bacterium]
MSTPPEIPSQEVETEIVERLPGEGEEPREENETPAADAEKGGGKSFFHPGSGLAIIGVDVVAFGLNAPTGFLATAFISLGAFVATFALVFGIQKNQHHDSTGWAILKALIGAVAAAVPFPIAGTALGAAILFLSGLPNTTGKVLDKLKG